MAGGVWHPIDLPEGYHTAARGQSFAMSAADCVEVCPRAAARSGCARSTGCHTSSGTRGNCVTTGPHTSTAARMPTDAETVLTSAFPLIQALR